MPTTVSEVLRRAIYRGNTERVFILLVEISHPALPEPIRMTSDGLTTTHDGEGYEPLPFAVTLPDDRESAQPRASLTVPNVEHENIQLIRSAEGAPTVTLVLVLDDNPDRIERGPWELELVDVSYDINSIRGTLQPRSLIGEPFPSGSYNTIDYPAL